MRQPAGSPRQRRCRRHGFARQARQKANTSQYSRHVATCAVSASSRPCSTVRRLAKFFSLGDLLGDVDMFGVSSFILPRESGEGGPPCAAGWWKGRGTRRNAGVYSLHRRPSMFFDHNEAASQTPPPPPFGWSPSPAFAGEDKRHRSRDACAPELCQRHFQNRPAKHDRVTPKPAVGPAFGSIMLLERKASGTPAGALVHPPHQADAARAKRRALACRRSTTALAAANQRRSSAPERASWDAAKTRVLPALACPSPATKSQTGRHAGRAFSRNRPGAEVTSPHPREPLSPRQPVSPADVLYRSEIGGFVTEIATDVKRCHRSSDAEARSA
jgi:hypothetical protein